jgi:hypothetical protein
MHRIRIRRPRARVLSPDPPDPDIGRPTGARADRAFLNCPAYTDKDGATRCGLPAEVEYRYTMNSTDGPLESAKISCPRRHHFNAPIEYVTLPEHPTAATALASPATAPTVQSAPPHARGEGGRP